jgi:diadenosine tetraphosphate (Ap4A) HIT family hydrolase
MGARAGGDQMMGRNAAAAVLPSPSMDVTCPLCSAAEGREILSANNHAVAIWDAFPVSPGHALIVSRRHVADLFELSAEEQSALWAILLAVKTAIAARYAPAGYNVGANSGAAAGQTVGHVHVHVIPRYEGDVPDPRGGVRWVLPERAAYWERSR